ncbi:MAG: hypothetical protein IJ758_02065, partial [Clostridia bacterium]|nr:hypothetical protein [Clostridia bacterium]
MVNSNVKKLYELLLNDEKLRENLQNKASKISSADDFNSFLENEIIPLAKERHLDISKKDILD